MDAQLRQRLLQVAGRGSVVAGTSVVSPRDQDSVLGAVRLCAEENVAVRVRSSPDGETAAPAGGIVLSLERLTGVTAHPAGLTLRAEAGAPLDAVRAAAAEHGLAVVGLGPDESRVGTVVARGGVPRRALTGVEAVLPTGESVAFGGAVLKDVVGYDVASVLLGSMGRLAVILAVTFRLEPLHARTPVDHAPGADAGGSHAMLVHAFDPRGLLQSQS